MPSFTIPKDTPINITYGGGEYTERMPSPTYVSWEENKAERDRKKKMLKKINVPTIDGGFMWLDELDSLDTLTNSVPGPQCIPAQEVGQCNKNKEHNMHINLNDGVPTDQKQRDYTLGRLAELKSSKKKELEVKFGLRGDETPETFNEFMTRLTSGKFTFPEDKKDKYIGTYGILDYIRWRDPSVKEDDAGFRTAADKLDAAYADARDQVVLSDSGQGLKILEDFKSATFH